MKQYSLLFLLLQITIQLSALDASVSFARFQTAEQPYVEVYVHIAGTTVNYISTKDALQASAEVLILFKQGEKIIQYDKYNLNSPLASFPKDFVDMKRFGLPAGNYQLEVVISDNNLADNVAEFSSELAIDAKSSLSDIQLLANVERGTDTAHPFAKHGYILEPLPYHFYNKQAERIWFYSEIYQAAATKGQALTITYFIERLENEQAKPIALKTKRKKSAELVPVLLGMDIRSLPSGNYNLVVEVRDSTEQLKGKKSVFFQRSNPYLNIDDTPLTTDVLQEEEVFVNALSLDEMQYALRALMPKAALGESDRLNTIIQGKDTSAKRLYLLNYWLQENPNLPERAYGAYMQVVRAVDNTFKSGFRNGFETDRGNIYLKYGRPDDMINVVDDPSAPPYEIWSYNDFPNTNQTNVRFLFYNPSLAGGDYVLLHSTARGEINNPQWEVELYRDAPNEIQGNDPFSATNMQDNVGRRAREYFTDF